MSVSEEFEAENWQISVNVIDSQPCSTSQRYIRNIQVDQIFLGVGSDEAIDLLIRICCVPGIDSIMVTPPTYGMYSVCAKINDVDVLSIPLTPSFHLQTQKVCTLYVVIQVMMIISVDAPSVACECEDRLSLQSWESNSNCVEKTRYHRDP